MNYQLNLQTNCPQCSKQLISEFGSGNAICSCGYMQNQSLQKVYDKRDRNIIKVYTIASLMILGIYAHCMSWGSYALQIPFLKASQMMGIASSKTYQTLVNACVQQNKWSCVDSTYLSWYKSTGDLETIAKLAHFRTQLKDFSGAAKAYESYFSLGGKDASTSLSYAQILEKNNDLEKALKYLKLSIQATGSEKLPAQATGAIVNILLKQQKFAEARETIFNFWATAENAKGYFNTEYDALEKRLGHTRVAKR